MWKSLTAAVLLVFGWLSPAMAAVAQDACAAADVNAGNGSTTVTSVTINMTVGSGSNRAMTAFIILGQTSTVPSTGLTIVWDQATTNQSLSQIVTASGAAVIPRAALWGYANGGAPLTSGAHTLTASWLVASDVYIQVCSWTGVDQTGGATSFPNSASVGNTNSTVTSMSIPVTSAVGDYVVAAWAAGGSGFSAVNETPVPGFGASGWDNGAVCCNAAANQATGASTVTLTSTFGGTNAWAGVATDIKASGASPSRAPTLMLLGVGP
jgi:hypothetical protein